MLFITLEFCYILFILHINDNVSIVRENNYENYDDLTRKENLYTISLKKYISEKCKFII